MPTPIQSAEKMAVGAKGGGKHWTKAEVEARQEEQENLRSEKGPLLRMPSWLSDDAKKVWKATRKRMAGIELLDVLDTDLLGVYCDLVARYQKSSETAVTQDDLKNLQALARLIQSFSDKLGMSPTGRARLAKRKAEPKPPSEFESEFD